MTMEYRTHRGAYDPWGCKADYDNEQIDEARRQQHEAQECEGAPGCADCLDEQEQAENEKGD